MASRPNKVTKGSAQPRTNQLRIHRESLSLIIITAFVGGGKRATACVEEREQLAGEGSLLPPCGLGTELGSSVLAAGTHTTKPSRQPEGTF